MAHWAEIDENNIVTRVCVGSNDDPDEGYQWLVDNLGGRWVQTSYNSNFRNQFAGIGFSYDEELDIFIEPSPYPSWIFNTQTYKWEAPTPEPKADRGYFWNEGTVSWVLPPSPFPSWSIVDHRWSPPTPRPTEGFWKWNEKDLSWEEFTPPVIEK
jgi:hypothetical protein